MLTCLKRTLVVMTFIAATGVNLNPAGAQRPDAVSVFIGFHDQPGVAEENLVRAAGGQIRYTYSIVPAIAASVPESAISGLMTNPRVSRVELVKEIHAFDHSGSTDLEYEAVWGVEHIGTEPVHTKSNYGAGVTVAVIDSGIACDHPELDVNCTGGENFVSGGSCSYDPNSSYGDSPFDDNSHGSHVAGTIAALLNGSNIVGVAPEARMVALKVLDGSGGGTWDNVVCALDWVQSYNDQVDPDIRVTNNSYGASGHPGLTVENAFQTTYNAGVLHVSSAGNSGSGETSTRKGKNKDDSVNTIGYPARFSSVVAVAATDEFDSRASFSSVGSEMELAAPGVSIYSTEPGGGYGIKSGTSMASPHVAGVAALVFSYFGNFTPDMVRDQLQNTANDIGSVGWDKETGYGLVDADEAAADTASVTNSPPSVSLTPPSEPVAGTTILEAFAEDVDGWVDSVEFKVDGERIGLDGSDQVSGTYSTSWDSCTSSDGAHTLKAIATDYEGASVSDELSVTVDTSGCSSESGSVIELTANGTKVRGDRTVSLGWTTDGATKDFYVFRDGENIADLNGLSYEDTAAKGNGLTYWVCEVISSGACSNQVIVWF